MTFLQRCGKDHPNAFPVTRLYKNAAGADVMIHLPQDYWQIVDWLEHRGDIDFQAWMIHCEAHPHENWSLSHLLMYWLWLDQCRRHRYGEPTFAPNPPEGYEPYGEAANDGQKLNANSQFRLHGMKALHHVHQL